MTLNRTPALSQTLALLTLLLAGLACAETTTSTPPPLQDVTPIPSGSVTPRDGRILSMDITEDQSGDFDAPFNLAKSAGMQATTLSVFWDEIETAPGEFEPDPNWLAIANLYYPSQEVMISLAISVIDTNNLRLPPNLAGKPLDDPQVIARFETLLDYIATQIPDLHLTSLAIGNEVDIYLGTDSRAWASFEAFFRQTAEHARRLWPGVPVGSKTTFDGLIGGPAPFIKSLNQYSDVAMVTYYPLQADFSVRQPDAVHRDFQTMVDAFPGKPIYLLEVGYPSGEDNHSSYELQAAFIHELFRAWDDHAEEIPLLNYTWMTDVSGEAVHQMTTYYRFGGRGFVSYLATLGLRTHQGQDKPAFTQWATETAARGWQGE